MEHATKAKVRTWPVKSDVLRLALVKDDICPECGGALDTGWECNRCGYDAQPIAQTIRSVP